MYLFKPVTCQTKVLLVGLDAYASQIPQQLILIGQFLHYFFFIVLLFQRTVSLMTLLCKVQSVIVPEGGAFLLFVVLNEN